MKFKLEVKQQTTLVLAIGILILVLAQVVGINQISAQTSIILRSIVAIGVLTEVGLVGIMKRKLDAVDWASVGVASIVLISVLLSVIQINWAWFNTIALILQGALIILFGIQIFKK